MRKECSAKLLAYRAFFWMMSNATSHDLRLDDDLAPLEVKLLVDGVRFAGRKPVRFKPFRTRPVSGDVVLAVGVALVQAWLHASNAKSVLSCLPREPGRILGGDGSD
jgi:hypothetical protein